MIRERLYIVQNRSGIANRKMESLPAEEAQQYNKQYLKEGNVMQEEVKEYITFTTTNKNGETVEMAVMDEFEFEHKNYVVGALIVDDVINEEGLYIYRVKTVGDDFTVEKITNQIDYQKIAQAYMEMETSNE